MKIAEPTVERLVQYHRLLEQLYNEGQKVVSSQEIGEMLAFKASQVGSLLFWRDRQKRSRVSC